MLSCSTCPPPSASNPALALPRVTALRPALQRCSLLPQRALPRALAVQRRRCRRAVQTAAAAVPVPGASAAVEVTPQRAEGKGRPGLAALLTPFSNPAANAKLLALCVAQMLGSVATLMHETYLPVYLADELGVSNTNIGNLQGAAQLLAKLSGSVSGTLADLVSPARMVILGAALTALNKPMYAASGAVAALAGTTACLYWVAGAKIFDRVAKGIREAPSKALIGELAESSGDCPAAAFGLRQSLAVAGGLMGAMVASLALRLTGRNYPLVFALSVVPATLALLLLTAAFGRGSAGTEAAEASSKSDAGAEAASTSVAAAEGNGAEPAVALSLPDKARALLGALRPAYWQALAVVAVLYMARFDAAFATLRARTVMSRATLPALVPLVMVTQGVLAAPMGLKAKASTAARNSVLLRGMAALVGADMCFAFIPSVAGMLLGATLLGLHMAMTHGVSVAMLSSYIPSHAVPGLGRIAGTAWSLTDLLLGGVLACSNLLAGRLCDWTAAAGRGGIGCFLGGAVACVLSGAALLAFSTWGELGRDDLLPGAAAVKAA